MNYKEKQKVFDEYLSQKVGMSEEELLWLRVDSGCDYLRNHYPDNYEHFKAMPIYWTWWLQLWIYRDARLIEELLDAPDDFMLTPEFYISRNKAETVKYYPNSIVYKAMCEGIVCKADKKVTV